MDLPPFSSFQESDNFSFMAFFMLLLSYFSVSLYIVINGLTEVERKMNDCVDLGLGYSTCYGIGFVMLYLVIQNLPFVSTFHAKCATCNVFEQFEKFLVG